MIPEIKRGDTITAKYLNTLGKGASRALRGVGAFGSDDMSLSAPILPGRGGSVGSGGSSVSIKLVLIDEDIEGITEYKPQKNLVPADIELTDAEESVGVTVVLEDPADVPVESLPLWSYKRRRLSLKYFVPDNPQNEGTAQGGSANTIILEDASIIDDFYIGSTITLEASGEVTGTVLSYDGTTQTATMEEDWDDEPVADVTHYTISSPDCLRLAYTVADDAGDESVPDDDRKIVRYSLTTVLYDDGKPFIRDEYRLDDFPDYPENEVFPPDGEGTYAVLEDDFLKKRYRGVAINNVLIMELCKELLPPELPLAGDES